MTILYDPQEYTKGFGFLRILFSWKTTVLPSVFKSGLFWLNFCLHISFQLFARWGPINQMNMASSRNGGGGEDIGAAAAGADAVDVGSDVRRRLAGGGVDAASGTAEYTARRDKGFDTTMAWTTLDVTVAGPNGLPYIDWRIATISMSLLVFFLVFWTITEHGRHNTFFSHTVGISGSVMQWAALVKLNLPESVGTAAYTPAPAYASAPEELVRPLVLDSDDGTKADTPSHRHWNALRYVLASMQICYYTIHGAGVDDQEWTAMMERGLLGGDEMRALQSYPGNQPWLALCWAVAEVQAQEKANKVQGGEEGIAEALARDRLLERFREITEKMRWHYGQIINGRKMQVPTSTWHLHLLLTSLALLTMPPGVPHGRFPSRTST